MKQVAFSFDNETNRKIAKGALIATGGALLTYLAQNISQADFGDYTPLVVALASILVNASKEFIQGEK